MNGAWQFRPGEQPVTENHRVVVATRPLALLPQLGLDFHKNKTFCVFNPLIFRTGIF
jgi:hypothetical protein